MRLSVRRSTGLIAGVLVARLALAAVAHGSETFGRSQGAPAGRTARTVTVRVVDGRLTGASIVKDAHEGGLRVSARVETARDFHAAVEAGVDEIIHVPGFRGDSTGTPARYAIAPADARLAAERGITVVTTLDELLESLDGGAQTASSHPAGVKAMLARNLRLLSESGVRIEIGSDHDGEAAAGATALDPSRVRDRATPLVAAARPAPARRP